MINFLNRLATFASIGLAFVITFLLGIWTDILDNRDALDDGSLLTWVIVIVIFSAIIKKTALSRDIIERAVYSIGRRTLSDDVIADIERDVTPEVPSVNKDMISQPSHELSSEGLQSEKDIEEKETFAEKAVTPIASVVEKLGGMEKSDMEDDVVPTPDVPAVIEPVIQKPNFIQVFFHENALAKVGGILLFLAVLFLMQLIYTRVGPMHKVLIGFFIGFLIFAVGMFLEKKKFKNEARILFGISILINYLVILSGRYLILTQDSGIATVLPESLAFFLLIMNTIFAVSVAIAHKSRSLLFFAIVVAFINPFLVSFAAHMSTLTVVFYAIMVSMAGISISAFYNKSDKHTASTLLAISFIGGSILSLFAPFTSNWEWIAKLGLLVVLTVITILYQVVTKQERLVPYYMSGAYFFFVMIIFTAFGAYKFFQAPGGISMLLVMILGFLTALFFIFRTTVVSMLFLLFVPMALLPVLFVTKIFYIGDLIFVLLGSMLFYLFAIVLLFEKIKTEAFKMCFLLIGIFSFIMSSIWKFNIHAHKSEFSHLQSYGILVALFLFMSFSYFFSSKKGMTQLYSVSSFVSAFILCLIVKRTGDFSLVSKLSIAVFVGINALWPLLNKNLLIKNIPNLIFGMMVGVVLAVYELFYFFYGTAGFNKSSIGLSFFLLAICYFGISFAMYYILKEHNRNLQDGEAKASISSTVYASLGIAISLFSMAIVYIFSGFASVVSTILLFEASLLFFFYMKTKSEKVYFGAIALFGFGMIRLFMMVASIDARDYFSLIPLAIIFASLVLSLKSIEFEKRQLRFFHDCLHVLGVIAIGIGVLMIVPLHAQGYLVLTLASYILLLTIVYGSIYSCAIKYLLLIVVPFVFLSQIFGLDSTVRYLKRLDLKHLIVLQYFTTIIFYISMLVFTKLSTLKESMRESNKQVASFYRILFYFYSFMITTQFVYHFFDKTSFIVTIYWGILALYFLSYGIQRDFVKLRTIGLYILTLTVIKILLFDIWSGIEDALIRVVALMIVGIIMITVSLLYTKKYGGDLKGEFSLENLKNK